MCVYMCVYVYVCLCVCVLVHVCACACVCLCMCVCGVCVCESVCDVVCVFGWICIDKKSKKSVVIKDRITGNTGFQKTVPYVTERPINLRPSRRELKNDVWKYLQMVVIGLYAVCGHMLDNQVHAHSPSSGTF